MAEMYCIYCGDTVDQSTMVCRGCKRSNTDRRIFSINSEYKNIKNASRNTNESTRVVQEYREGTQINVEMRNELYKKLQSAQKARYVIAVYQCILGILTVLMCFGIFSIGLAVWSIVRARKIKENMVDFYYHPENIVPYYDSYGGTLIVEIILNFLFGGILGIIGPIMENSAKAFVLKHRASFI